MKFTIMIKDGNRTILDVTSRTKISWENISLDDLKRVIETEQLLERLTGFRFHINITES